MMLTFTGDGDGATFPIGRERIEKKDTFSIHNVQGLAHSHLLHLSTLVKYERFTEIGYFSMIMS